MQFEKLVRSCLYNWLGYGNVNGRFWFIGTEEGGAEIWRQATKTLEESLKLRSGYNLGMDFQTVWEELYQIPLESFKGPCVWRYMAVFLLGMDDKPVNKDTVNDFVFYSKLLGSLSSNHFMAELLPLPKRSKNDISDYQTVWRSVEEYHREVIPRRFALIQETLEENSDIDLVVSYEHILSEKFIKYFGQRGSLLKAWNYRSESYALYEIRLEGGRSIKFLTTPFFGNGRISYDGLLIASEKIKEVI